MQSNIDLEALQKVGYRLTSATMGHKLTGGWWVPAKHLLYTSKKVCTAIKKGGARIIVTFPPRHGKSEFLSVNTPVWYLDNNPDKSVILATYGAELSSDFSRRVRDTFADKELHGLLRARLKDDAQKVDRFLMEHFPKPGGMISAGIGGPIIGRGADLFLVDDYIKNAEDSLSETVRDKAWNWFLSTAFTRLEPNASFIVLATRWNQDDIIGRLLTEQPGVWTLINLPAIAQDNDPLGRAPGEALWPERYSIADLMVIKAALGNYWWEAMYQQNPLPSMTSAERGVKLKVITEDMLPHSSKLKTVRAWDLAATEHAGDWTAGPKMSFCNDDGYTYIHDMQRFQKSPSGVEEMVKTVAWSDGTGVPIWMEQEPGSSGKIVIDHYKTNVLPNFNIKGQKPSGPVEVRCSPFLAAVEAGKVKIVNGPYLKAFKSELDGFPDAANDDQVVAASLAWERLGHGRFGSVIWGHSGRRAGNSSIIVPGDSRRNINTGVIW